MKRRAAESAGPGPSKAIREYRDGKINSTQYFRAVREETAREIRRELTKPNGTGSEQGSR
jgi:hypothetical protein